MATELEKKRNIKYLNRDFSNLKKDMIEHLRVHFPNEISDFNESSVGLMLLELGAFIGDNMSFYLDKKFNESFVETAREKKNLFKHAKQLGFKPFGKSSATGVVDAFLVVPVSSSNQEIIPDMRFAGTIKRGAKLKNSVGETYETLTDIDFSTVDASDSNFVQVADRDSSGNPTTFALKKTGVEIKAGETKTTTFVVGNYEPFKQITIPEDDVLEVIKVTDSEGNEWTEVDFLAQDTVFDGKASTGADKVDVPFVLKLRSVPFRFITDFDIDSNRMTLTFGTGDAESFDGDLVPNLGDLSLPLFGKDTFTDFFLDPQNFLKTRTLGLAPVNTTLTIQYRVGGGSKTNSASTEINTVAESIFEIGDSTLDSNTVSDVGNSFSVLNTRPVQGGRDETSIDEIKALISAHHASQGRTVSAEDFITRSLSMPSKFGSVFRVNAKASQLNKNAVELIVLSLNSAGQVAVAPLDLKRNLKKYLSRFRMLTDAIEILDGEILNIGVKFEVLTNPDFNKTEVIATAIETLQDHFKVSNFQLNQPINLTDLYVLLGSIPGVLSVISLSIINRVGNFEGRSYSTTVHNISENTQNGIVYSKENAIFEVKYPTKDIVGIAK